ncbi:TRAP transporter small permease [Tropicimonas sp. IMCC34043]|uniref:TRAP transporter small permease n=1 Tax=Tropicimonas sp. IMCC34043 TaxID=2248760 RepID=UPI000E24597A|nr:TRAP transporter small permease [Tropicimonas sp. IMCC34043]
MRETLIWYQTFLDWLERAGFLVAMVLLALLFLNTATGIIVDQVVGNSLVWVEEINNLLFAWTIFVGAGVVARRGGHIGVDMFYESSGRRIQGLLRIVYAIAALIIASVMVYFGLKMASFVGKSQTSLYLSINLYWYYLSIPVGGALLGLMSLGAALPDPRSAADRHKFTATLENGD